jgi:glutathione synthase/RimK-type ligase-like ATP-grasp enzyme
VPAKICILTPDPGYHERWQVVADEYHSVFGDTLSFRAWNDAGDLSGFALILPLLAWGYPKSPSTWFAALDAWEAQGLPFANPISVLRWNTDKDYLLDLEAAGVAIVPTVEVHGLTAADMEEARVRFGCDTLIIKPPISAGADRTYRLGPNDAIPFDVLEKEMLVQPLMPAITTEGEFSLFYFGGVLSHAILKTPASGDFRVQEQFGGREVTVNAPQSVRQLAQAALAAAPAPPLYARVDMVRGGDWQFYLMELEMIEPALFLSHAADRGAAFSAAVRTLLT